MYSSTPQFDGEGPGLQPSAAVTADASASPVTAYNASAPSALASKESGAIGAASMASTYKEPGKGAGMSSEYRGNAGGSAAPKSASKPIDKSNWDRSTKVSPSTVASVKSAGAGNMGYAAARNAKYGMPGYDGSTFSQNKPASNEYKEATKRVYPSAYKSVTTPFKPVPGTAGGGKYVGSTFVPNVKKSGGGGSASAVK
jgi:hypothetical protein